MRAPVHVAIVNYRTGPLVVECLRSLAGEVAAHPGSRVTVVDNCSGDDSGDVIASAIAREGWGNWAELRRAPVNGGFSYGNNQVVRPALASGHAPAFFWILNPDTRLEPGAMTELVDFLEAHPRVGIAGSSMRNGDGSLWPHAFRFPSIWSEMASGLRLSLVGRLLKNRVVLRTMPQDAPSQVDWLPGASMLVRREVFETVGLMDEGYFLYFEETDFCLAAHRAGWETWYVPQSVITHIAGQSTGVTGEQALVKRRPQYWFDSRRRYWVKNHGRAYSAATDLVWALAYSTSRLRSWLMRKPSGQPPHYCFDILRNSALFHSGLPTSTVAASPAHGHPDRPAQR
jgi:N-acetylglucosaminyl-diphospho-decaprenol L-rhamnosyltransferase